MGRKYLKHDLVQMVKDNTQNILHGHVVCVYTICPKCHQEVDSFKLHEARTRIFLVLAENIVSGIQSSNIALLNSPSETAEVFFACLLTNACRYIFDNIKFPFIDN